ncbi:penicillin acylase family protein [Pseudoalteromonas ardens]|uniref:Penicillin amidase n=1 Tax=Pseudoalteromonas rubra TaxID=43658 RepID=A0A0L0EX84_9GAMM|nr:penicillin acylase family protein [Pseudoalteromonas sp. R96]KNC69024.1 penicillin amidase [Pseudoalteromonas rubra]MDK1313860.1 penicillin acylase family protein [Pseudoalteromonas sp. R96]
MSTKRKYSKVKKALLLSGLSTMVVASCTSYWLWARLNSALPLLNGEVAIPHVEHEVVIDRDRNGLPSIVAHTRTDAARAMGFLHAQERFFQMDFLRRKAAGELSALFGESFINADKEARLHQFKHSARQAYNNLDEQHKALLDAYVEGVNSGLDKLKSAPFEYAVLKATPATWQPEDSFLVSFAMFMEMQGRDYHNALYLNKLQQTLPQALVDFLVPLGTSWDQPLDAQQIATAPMPGADVYSLAESEESGQHNLALTEHQQSLYALTLKDTPSVAGSNNWAVSGDNTLSGKALVANDMHLNLTVPNIWYRVEYTWQEATKEHQLSGISLPGLPLMIAGSNQHIAWGFTNSMGDWSDLLRIPAEKSQALVTPVTQTIDVKDAAPIEFVVDMTPYGPVVEREENGDLLVLRWVAHSPMAVNLGLFDVELATSVDASLPLFNDAHMTHLNVVVGDEQGNIGWTMLGALPERAHSVWAPVAYDNDKYAWSGFLDSAQYPKRMNPESGFLFTANARVVSGDELDVIGRENYALGARANQIHNGLRVMHEPSEAQMLRTQLDSRAIFLQRWQYLLLSILDEEFLAEHPELTEYREIVNNWNGKATKESTGYLLVRAFRTQVARRVFGGILNDVHERNPDSNVFDYFSLTSQWEGPLWQLVNEQPAHLLNTRYDSWQGLYADALSFLNNHFNNTHGTIANAKWGDYNKVAISHPVAGALPLIGKFFNIPEYGADGDINMPLVQEQNFGASMRMGVTPGEEQSGFFHMPVGQASNPMSPYWLAGHKDWQEGVFSSFLPQETEYSLKLIPAEHKE